MFDQFISIAKSLVSSKSNGGKLVPKPLLWWHYYMFVYLIAAALYLIGDGQFRRHFHCQGAGGIDEKTITDFCWINGTTTVRDLGETSTAQELPHIGLNHLTDDHKYQVYSHKYIQVLWLVYPILIVIAAIPFIAWMRIFRNDVLRSLLKLPGCEDIPMCRQAEQARLYEFFSGRPSDASIQELEQQLSEQATFAKLPQSEQAVVRLNFIDNFVNAYDRQLEFYANQLICMLMTKDPAKYKISIQNLGPRLILDRLISVLCAISPMLIMTFFVGPEFLTYGLKYALSSLDYLFKLVISGFSQDMANRSIDYSISEVIFPTVTQCEYLQRGYGGGSERLVTICQVAMNKVSSIVFLTVWWAVTIFSIPELYHLYLLVVTSWSDTLLSSWFGSRYWPSFRKEADSIVNFRPRHAQLLKRGQGLEKLHRQTEPNGGNQVVGPTNQTSAPSGKRNLLEIERRDYNNNMRQTSNSNNNYHTNMPPTVHLNQNDHKHLDIEDGDESTIADKQHKQWCRSLQRLFCSLARTIFRRPDCGHKASQRRRKLEEEPGPDRNIYYIFYLLYLRLGSRKSVEDVIRMTATALDKYIEEREEAHRRSRQQLVWMQKQQMQQHQDQARPVDDDQMSLSNLSQDSRQLVRPIIDETTTT